MAPFTGQQNSTEVLPNGPIKTDESLNKLKSLSENALKFQGDSFADGLSNPPEKAVLRVRIALDIGKNSSDFINISNEVNANPLHHFAASITAKYGVPMDKLENDPVLRKSFIDLRDFELHYKKRQNEKRKYFTACEKADLALAGYVGEKNEAKVFREAYMHNEKDRVFTYKLAKLNENPNVTAEQKILIQNHWLKKQELTSKLEKKEITQEEYSVQSDKLNEDTAKKSGDKDLQKEGEEYKKNVELVGVDRAVRSIITPLVSSDKPVSDQVQATQALSTFSSDSYHMDFHDDGASVLAGPEKFPMEVHVFKNDQTNKYVYYIVDQYSDDVERVEAENVAEALDGRYLDSYISDNIDVVSDDNDSPDNVPDAMMVKFGQKLVGDAKSRGYKIEGENREVLNAMVKVLELDSVKYPDYYKKIEALNVYFEKEDNIAGLRKKLLAGEKPSLDELLK